MVDVLIWTSVLGGFAVVGSAVQTAKEKRKWKKENQRKFEEIKRRNRLRVIRGEK